MHHCGKKNVKKYSALVNFQENKSSEKFRTYTFINQLFSKIILTK